MKLNINTIPTVFTTRTSGRRGSAKNSMGRITELQNYCGIWRFTIRSAFTPLAVASHGGWDG